MRFETNMPSPDNWEPTNEETCNHEWETLRDKGLVVCIHCSLEHKIEDILKRNKDEADISTVSNIATRRPPNSPEKTP